MKIHIVKRGETLYQIARQYQVTVEELRADNGMVEGQVLVPGQALVVMTGERSPKQSSIWVNGYAYPYIQPAVLAQALPSLSSLSIFSYGFTEDGTLIEAEDEDLLTSAFETGVLAIMTLSSITEDGSFSGERASKLFENPRLQDTVLTNILSVMQEKGYGGLDIDFEYVFPQDKEGFLGFIQKAVDMLHPYGYQVNVDLAPKTSASQSGLLYESHDYAQIGQIADTVLLMTYEWGYTYGPPMAVAPLDKVRQVVEYALTEIPREKIWMGIPNYGYDWPLPYIRSITAARSIGNVEAVWIAGYYGAEILFDDSSMSPYFYYTDRMNIQHVVWFEDARSIRAKLSLVQEKELFGVGYWNLMRPFPQNWVILNDKFDSIHII